MSNVFDLQPALPGRRITFDGPYGCASYYLDGPEDTGPSDELPLLLIHSVNAAASAYEIGPLYEHYRQHRTVIAPDLPGYGFSDRPDMMYTPRVMIDTLSAIIKHACGADSEPIDAVALSLSCEFLALTATEQPDTFRTLGFISPTGFSGTRKRSVGPGETREIPRLYRSLTMSSNVGSGLFRALTVRPSIRYFLRKSWGQKEIDEGAFEYAYQTSHQPGARHAPFCFLSGYLFTADIARTFRELPHPVWMAHGRRGDFTDYRREQEYADKTNWQIHAYNTGSLPQFEILDQLTHDYDHFVEGAVTA